MDLRVAPGPHVAVMDPWAPQADCRILVVDDNPGGRTTLVHMLRAGGYANVLEAATGGECLLLAREHHPGLILLDVNLPDVSGIRVAHTLKTDDGTADAAIIQMSASFTSEDQQAEGLEAGADVYLTRPFQARHLLATVKALLRARATEQRLAQAVRARDEFLAMAAHDLRSPLAALHMRIELLCRSIERGPQTLDKDRVAQPLRLIDEQARQINALLENLLDVSALNSGAVQLALEEFDLVLLARELVQRYLPQAAAAQSSVTVAETGPVLGWWDRLSLEQVLGNLLSNAIKYGAGQPIRVEIGADEACAYLKVSDRGIGIHPDKQPFIFRRFSRALQGRQQGSYGLGLWIVHRLVDSLGGSIRVDSVLRQGTTFTVQLPLLRQQPAQDLPQAAEQA
jgi:two-component system, sensor histidine kinase and response regulator